MTLSPEIARAALTSLVDQRARIDEAITQVRILIEEPLLAKLGSPVPKRRGRPPGSGKRNAAAANGAPQSSRSKPTPVKTRTMTPEGRARIAAAARKRWAAVHKAQRAERRAAAAA